MKTIKRTYENKKTFSKKWVNRLLLIGVINAEIPFILAAFGKEPNEALGIAWITEIVAVILGYLCKSYFETKQERKQDLEDAKFLHDEEDSEDE
jgi:hypothetical protein